jgi:aspartate aminotransferase
MKIKISRRVESLSESATLKMAQIAAQLKTEGKDIISLSLGEPDFNTPERIKKAAIEAINHNITHYPPVAGFPELKKAISDKFKNEYDLTYLPSQVVVSSGAKQSLSNAILTLLEKGDEVIVLAPYWVSYPDMIKLAEAEMVVIKSEIENNFKIIPEELERAITPKTKMVLFNSPSNPSGAVYTYKELEKFAELFRKYPDIFILSDDIYEHINYIEKPCTLAQFPGMQDQVIIVNGVSKGYAMTGWRIGYMLAPKPVADACCKLQGQLTSAPCSISQMAALEAIRSDGESIAEMKVQFHKRRDLVAGKLKDIAGIKYNIPEGAFYFLIDISHFVGKTYGNYHIVDGDEMCNFLLEYACVSTVSGSAFGVPECIRISYATSEDLLIRAMDKIKSALELLK